MKEKSIILMDQRLHHELVKLIRLIYLEDTISESEIDEQIDRILDFYDFVLSTCFKNCASSPEGVSFVRVVEIESFYNSFSKNYKHKELLHYEKAFLDDLIHNTIFDDENDPLRKIRFSVSKKELSDLLNTYEKRSENMIGESFVKGYRAALNRIREDLDLYS